MPIFEYKGKDYEVSDEHAKSFVEEYPDASIIMRRGGDEYRVKMNDYDSFISEMPAQTKDDTPDFRSYTSPQPKTEDTAAQTTLLPQQEVQRTNAQAMSAQMPVVQSTEPSTTVKAPEDILLSGQLRRARTKLDELQAKRNQRVSEVNDEVTEFNNTKLTGLGRALIGGQMYVDMQRSDPEKNALDVAIRQTEELVKDLEEQQDRERGVDVGFWRGFGRVAGDVRSWDRGMSNAKDAITMLNADRLVDKNATEGERAAYNEMMEALYNKEQAEQAYGGNASFWNRAGMMTGHMPSFMLDFAITGGGFKGLNMLSNGATKAATKALGKEVVDEMAKQGFKTYVKNNGAKGLGQYAADWTIKALGTTGDDLLVRAPLMTNTVQAGSTVADIVDRKLGGVTVNEDGTYDFSNDKTWSSAIWQGEANSIIENYSEMFGSHLDPVVTFGNMSKLANVVGAKRLGSVLAKADAGALSGVMGQTQKLFNKMGVSDYFGEVAEEYYGQLWRTMLNLDDAYQQNPDGTRTNLLDTGKFHGDIWGGMALSMGLMGVGKHTLTGAQYLSMKHGVNKADSRAAELLGKDVWEPLRQTIDQTTNDDIGSLAERIVSDPDFTNDELAAVFTYMERSLNMRGFNLGALAQKRGGEENPSAQSMDEHYIDGYNINSPQEMTDAKNMYDMQRQRVADALGEDVLADIDSDPEAAIGKLGEDEPTNRTVIEYLNAKMVYDGMNKRVADDADARIAESDALVDSHTHKKTGMVQGATMKDEDRKVYIVNGNVVPLQDGTGIDLDASDNSIIIRDAESGELEQVSPEVLLNVDAGIDPTAEKQAAREAIEAEVRANAERMQNGVVGFAPGDVYTVLGEDGNTQQVEIVQDNGDYTVTVKVNGEAVEEVMTKEQIQNEVDAYNKQRVVLVADSAQGAEAADNTVDAKPNYELNAHVTLQTPEGVVTGNINQAENDDNLIEVQVNKPFGGKKTVDMYTREELDNMVVEVADENGNVIWSKPAESTEAAANVQGTENVNTQPEGGAENVNTAPATPIVRGKHDQIDAVESIKAGTTPQQMADAYMQEYGDEEGLPLSTAQEKLAQVQEERQKTKDVDLKNGPLRKQEKFWNEVVDLLTPKEAAPAEESRQETVGTPVALQYLLEGGKGSIENAGYFFYAIQAAFPHIGAQLQEIRNSMPAEMLGMAPDAFVASNPSQLQEVRRLVEATYGEAGTRILDQMLANSTGFYPREGKALDLEIENLKPQENAEGVSEEEADALISQMKGTADVAVERELTPEAWEEEFGEDGITETPVGPVKMGENQYLKLLKKKRGGYFGMIKPTLTNPDIVLEEVDEKEGAERQSKYLFVKTFVKPDGSRYVHFESVTVMKESLEVSISSHEVNEDALKRKMQHDKMLHLDKRFLNSDGRLIEPPVEGSDLVPTPNIVSSADKGTDKSVTAEGTQEEISENAQNATQSEQNELEKAEKERIDALVPAIEDVADDMQTADEFVAGLFGNGIRITPESFRKETGLGWEEQRRLVGIIAGKENGGLTVEQAAETIVENYRAELAERGFSGDSMEMRDMVIDILSSGNPRAYAKEAAARRAEQALHREMEAFDRYTQEAFHMSAEEYIMYEESMLPKYIEQYKDFDEQEYYSNFADEQSTQNEHDTTRESAETGGSREILSEEQPSATPGEGTAGEGQQGGTLQGDVQGNAQERIARAEAEVDTTPTDKQKEAGNYKKGHVRIGKFNISIEQPKGSVRSGVDANGNKWETTMQNTYGYFLGTEGVDGDHIDVFLSDNIDGWNGEVFVVDQRNDDGSFDEHKVMMGFNSIEEAKRAYLSNYSEGWQGLGAITGVSVEEFEKWVSSSHRKTKPFAEYKNVKVTEGQNQTRFSSSMFEDAERIAREEQRRAPLRRTARAWEKILGVKVTLMERLEDVKNPVARREIEAAEKKGKNVPGWYSDTEGVFLYLPHVKDVTEVDKTCVHEIVSHKGLKELLGQEKFDELCRKVWDIMSPAERREYMSYPNVETKLQAADEYIAHLSEKVELTARERSVWQKIMDFIAGLLGRKADNRSKAASIVGKETLSRKDIAELVRLSYAEYLQRNGREEAVKEEGKISFRFTEEEQGIIDEAKKNGTYMKAPNGQPTNLNEKQWAQVRTKAFKKWFGDWEKVLRIAKLRKSKPVRMTGKEHIGKYELNRESAQDYILKNLRGSYEIADTKESIKIAKKGAKKVTSHSMGNEAHMMSIAIIPEIIESSIFITELPAGKDDAQYDSYRYYVCGLDYNGENYTVKITVGVKNGDFYYDHSLTEVEKGKLLDLIESNQAVNHKGFTPTGDAPIPSYALSGVKDTKLLSILQANSSKIVDENGEPMVVYHQTENSFTEFDPYHEGAGASDHETPFGIFLKPTPRNIGIRGGIQMPLYAEIRNPLTFTDRKGLSGWLNSNVENYSELAKRLEGVESEYNARFDEAMREDNKLAVANYEKWQNGEISKDEYMESYDGSKAETVLNEWKNAEDVLRVELKRMVDDAIRSSNYDGVILESDKGSFGRETKTLVALDPNQIKSATENNGEFSAENNDIRFRFIGEQGASNLDKAEEATTRLDNLAVAREMEAAEKDANVRFNEELEKYMEDGAGANRLFHLGNPMGVMAQFLPDLPVVLRPRILSKASRTKHNVSLESLRNLPGYISYPIFVFKREDGALGILTEIKDRDGKNVCVAIELGKTIQDGGTLLEVNDVRSIHGRDVENLILPIAHNNTLVYADKEKGLEWLSSASYNYQQEIDIQDLDSAAKVIKDFQNPSVEGGIRFRSVDKLRDRYDKMVRLPNKIGSVKWYENLPYRLREAYQDSMLSLKVLQDVILEETGNTMTSGENAYMAENQMSSKNKAEAEMYERDFFKPMMEEVKNLLAAGATYDEVQKYLFAKHGLERNMEMYKKNKQEAIDKWIEERTKQLVDGGMAQADARTQAQQDIALYPSMSDSELDKQYRRDYSGLTALTEKDNVADAEAEATKMVSDFEGRFDTAGLWGKINAATRETLRKSYDSGMMDKATYEKILGMYHYYIPLRGWDADVAEKEYEYLSDRGMNLSPVLKKTEGRTSLADDPIATIGFMAEGAIVQGNRNLMKQRFMNFVLNNPTSLVSVSKQWYVEQADGTWKPDNPQIPADATGDQVAAIVEQHEQKMLSLGKKAKAKRAGLKLDLHATKQEGQEHMVRVKRGGKEYCLYINGSPRAAQALNGMTNPDASDSDLYKAASAVKNFMARMFTSQNPAFVVSNLSRDLIWAGTAVAVRENKDYAAQYTKNVGKAFKNATLPRLLHKYQNGTLDMNVEEERLFMEFIKHGGETGFTQITSVEDYKKDIERFVKEVQSGKSIGKKAWDGFFDTVEFLNRSAEDTTRFMVYMTSRQMGRDVATSVSDAKEITVNFNKKGSGGLGASVMNFCYIFFNAAIQSLSGFGKMMAEHPKRTLAGLTAYASAGVIVPAMSIALQALTGDDDDESYWDLPEWIRRNNLVLYVPFTDSGFITIPLPHELRPFYAMGEIALSAMCGREDVEDGLRKAALNFAEMLPLDFTGNGGNLAVNLTPTVAQPAAQIIANKDYTGKPIYKDYEWNKRDPEWTKAYKGTSPWIVEGTKWLNRLSGGDDVKSGAVDLNPALIEHVLESYTGGAGKTFNRTMKTFQMMWDEDMRQWRNVPVISSFVQSGDERIQGSDVNNRYYEAKDEFEDTKHLLSGYKKQKKEHKPGTADYIEYARKLDELMNSDEYKRYKVFKGRQKAIKKVSDKLKETDDRNRIDSLNTRLMQLKEEMLEELEKADDSPKP